MLVLEIEFLLGVSFAALGPDSAEPDWPPQPDRVFSALVASWAARGQQGPERAALEWLERQEPPLLDASDYFARPAPTVFVPPNDPQTGRVGDATVLPSLRRRQARRFPAALPLDPVMRLVWREASDPPLSSLDALARDVASVGHSASLTRCRFTVEERDVTALPPARRRVYQGRLSELEAAFAASRRPVPGAQVRSVQPKLAPVCSNFGTDWLVFEIERDLTGMPPDYLSALDVRAAPMVAKALRDALMSGFGQAGLEVPTWVSGHEQDGSPTRAPHLAIVPLTFTGFRHSDGTLLGFAMIPPAGQGSLLDNEMVIAALRRVAKDIGGRRQLTLRLGTHGVLALRIVQETKRGSLDPARYLAASRNWASVTPIVLDRHLKAKLPVDRMAEAEAIIVESCRRIGLPAPARVRLDKHSAIHGAVSAAPSGNAPRWTAWRVPDRMAGRGLTHAVVSFDDVISGPVLLGAGRFCGLGLCLPIDAGDAP
jgi:CRISPR-associated protein Csb2